MTARNEATILSRRSGPAQDGVESEPQRVEKKSIPANPGRAIDVLICEFDKLRFQSDPFRAYN